MAHLAKRFGLDLTNALARHLKLLSNLFQSAGIAIHKTETLFQNLAFAFGEGFQHILDLVLKEDDRSHVGGILGSLVLNEITKTGVIAVAHGGL